MINQRYKELILEGLEGLPVEILAEITDFVYFVRKRAMHPESFSKELEATLLEADLHLLDQNERRHLEEEFADYERRYPTE
jgi:hypothetical protein